MVERYYRIPTGPELARLFFESGLTIDEVREGLQEGGYYAARYNPKGRTLTVGSTPFSAYDIHPEVKDIKLIKRKT